MFCFARVARVFASLADDTKASEASEASHGEETACSRELGRMSNYNNDRSERACPCELMPRTTTIHDMLSHSAVKVAISPGDPDGRSEIEANNALH